MSSWQIYVRRALALIALFGVVLSAPARAHPHVWVSVETTVVYDKGTIVALRQRWAFDELYTSMAIQGLDTNNDGVYDRSELAELAKVNMEGLKEFDYFTIVKLGQQALSFGTPTEYFMEYIEASPLTLSEPASSDPQASGTANATDTTTGVWSRLTGAVTASAAPQKPKVLALEFVLPLQEPVLAEADGFSFAVADPSFFIWFDFAQDKPVIKLAGAPAGCKAEITSPKQDGFTSPSTGDPTINFSFGAAKAVTISCPK